MRGVKKRLIGQHFHIMHNPLSTHCGHSRGRRRCYFTGEGLDSVFNGLCKYGNCCNLTNLAQLAPSSTLLRRGQTVGVPELLDDRIEVAFDEQMYCFAMA